MAAVLPCCGNAMGTKTVLMAVTKRTVVSKELDSLTCHLARTYALY